MTTRARPDALLDSNVLVAFVVGTHEHHRPSFALLNERDPAVFCVAAHSYAEAFTTLTKRSGPASYARAPHEAWAALNVLAASTRLVGLTPAQTFDTVRAFAAAGGIGARVYDRLIGAAALSAGAGAIVTWNTGHMRSLFPELAVETPTEFLHRSTRI